MARPLGSDFLHNFRYHVVASGVAGAVMLRPDGRPQAGFSAVSTPSIQIESVPYKEGTMNYARKQPGVPSFEDITMSRGVTRGDTSFWSWAQRTAEGGGEYRADLLINVYHRAQALGAATPATANTLFINLDSDPAIRVHVLEAFPTTHKLLGDLDASSSDISIMELGVSYETAWREDVAAA